jgi:hypothetical protein
MTVLTCALLEQRRTNSNHIPDHGIKAVLAVPVHMQHSQQRLTLARLPAPSVTTLTAPCSNVTHVTHATHVMLIDAFSAPHNACGM